MTRAINWLSIRRILTLSISLLIWNSCAAFEIRVSAPDDPDFALQFGSAVFSEFTEIVSVTSPVPHLILGDQSGSENNKLAYRGSLPNCDIPLTIIGKKPDGTLVRYTGKINVAKTKPDDVKQAAVVKGDGSKLPDFIDDLSGTYNVDVVSSTASTPDGSLEIAIVLRDKSTGAIVPKKETEIILRDKAKVANNGLVLHKPDCFSTCNDACDSVLTVDAAAGSKVQTASVPAGNSKAYAGMQTKWEHKCGTDAFKDIPTVCGPNTCANGGTCSTGAADSSSICTCRVQDNEVFGPRCQQLTRSYQSSGPTSSIITHHSIQPDTMHPQTLTVSFELAGLCTLSELGTGSLCTILKLEANSKALLKVEQGRVPEPRYTSATLPASPPNPEKMTIYSDRYVQNSRWMEVTVSVQVAGSELKAVTVFCSKEAGSPSCFERTAVSPVNGDLKLADAVVNLGGEFRGCFRHVRINGRLVDLQPSRVTGDASLTHEGCSGQAGACSGGGSGNGHICGPKSVCYGQLGSPAHGAGSCSCRCAHSTRMLTEKITMATQCASPCSKGAPIVSTGASDNDLAWAMADGGPISLDPRAPLTATFRLRTRQTDAGELFKIEATSSAGGVIILLKIHSEALTCCIDANCYAFVPMPVSDGAWHDVSVRLIKSQLVVRVDDHSKIHAVTPLTVSGAKVSMRLPSSCISGVRLSDIYMPTGDADPTQDSASSAVKLSAGGSATAGADCADPAQAACACNAATEDCDSSWGAKSCRCKPGFKRYTSGGSCEGPPAGNPCTRLGISCPNAGGSCVESGGKWQVCQ